MASPGHKPSPVLYRQSIPRTPGLAWQKTTRCPPHPDAAVHASWQNTGSGESTFQIAPRRYPRWLLVLEYRGQQLASQWSVKSSQVHERKARPNSQAVTSQWVVLAAGYIFSRRLSTSYSKGDLARAVPSHVSNAQKVLVGCSPCLAGFHMADVAEPWPAY